MVTLKFVVATPSVNCRDLHATWHGHADETSTLIQHTKPCMAVAAAATTDTDDCDHQDAGSLTRHRMSRFVAFASRVGVNGVGRDAQVSMTTCDALGEE